LSWKTEGEKVILKLTEPSESGMWSWALYHCTANCRSVNRSVERRTGRFAQLPVSWDSKLRSGIPRNSESRMTVLVRNCNIVPDRPIDRLENLIFRSLLRNCRLPGPFETAIFRLSAVMLHVTFMFVSCRSGRLFWLQHFCSETLRRCITETSRSHKLHFISQIVEIRVAMNCASSGSSRHMVTKLMAARSDHKWTSFPYSSR
jgi:hypothetical protein